MIEIYVDGKNFNKKGSRYAIVLVGSGLDGSGDYVWERAFDAGKTTNNQSVLYAITFALKSIKPGAKLKDVTVYTDNKFALSMLEKEDYESSMVGVGKWKKKPSSNKDLIEMIRNNVDEYPSIKIKNNNDASDSKYVKKVKELCEMASDGNYADNRG